MCDQVETAGVHGPCAPRGARHSSRLARAPVVLVSSVRVRARAARECVETPCTRVFPLPVVLEINTRALHAMYSSARQNLGKSHLKKSQISRIWSQSAPIRAQICHNCCPA